MASAITKPQNRFRKRAGRWRWLTISVVSLILLRLAYRPSDGEVDPRLVLISPGSYQLRRVCEDGSLELFLDERQRRWFKLRLLGIEVVETKGVVDQLSRMLAGQPVQLRFDRRRLDEDQTLMAYVYVGQRFVCLELVRLGLARAATQQSDFGPIARQLHKTQLEAQTQRRGMWTE